MGNLFHNRQAYKVPAPNVIVTRAGDQEAHRITVPHADTEGRPILHIYSRSDHVRGCLFLRPPLDCPIVSDEFVSSRAYSIFINSTR